MKKAKQEEKPVKINKMMSFAEILQIDRALAIPLMETGMHCVGCPMAMQETLEEGAMAHGLDPDSLVKKLNNMLDKQNKKKNKEKKK
jgi:hybrid cluster-associated redox disulfide protein